MKKDLFDSISSLPKEIRELVEYYAMKTPLNHEELENFLTRAESLGYTFNINLDGSVYDLQKIC